MQQTTNVFMILKNLFEDIMIVFQAQEFLSVINEPQVGFKSRYWLNSDFLLPLISGFLRNKFKISTDQLVKY